MLTFAVLTRLSSGGAQSAKSLEELERKAMDHVKLDVGAANRLEARLFLVLTTTST